MIEIKKSKIVEESKPNKIYLALYKVEGIASWQVSGIFYHKIDEVRPNLAAFKPTRIFIVEVELPVEDVQSYLGA